MFRTRIGDTLLKRSRQHRCCLFSTISNAGVRALVLNAGSSSLKYGLFDIAFDDDGDPCQETSELLASGLVENIGSGSRHKYTSRGHTITQEMPVPDHKAGLQEAIALLTKQNTGIIEDVNNIDVVGHRVVHGGAHFSKATIVDGNVIEAIQDTSKLAPLHNPPNLLGITVAQGVFQNVPHVAVFDTAFHQTMPPESYTYAIPKEVAQAHGIRKYGFHGSSYTYVLDVLCKYLGKQKGEINAIICHLGNGASMACVQKGRCVDTSMGMTPLEGLVMGTRAGDLDAGVLTHLSEYAAMSPKEMDAFLNKQSGLQGLCGNSDMRTVQEMAQAGHADSCLAEAVFVQRIRKYLGAYIVKLGGNVDAIAFTGGIGENSSHIRELVCADLGPLGIQLDTAKNGLSCGGQAWRISTHMARTKVVVVPAKEELSIALQAAALAQAVPRRPLYTPDVEAQIASRPNTAPPVSSAVFISGLMRARDMDHAMTEVGIMQEMAPQCKKVGYFRVLSTDPQADRKIKLMKARFGIESTPDVMYGATAAEAAEAMATDTDEVLVQKILQRFEEYRRGYDFVLVGGISLEGRARYWDERLSTALNVPVVSTWHYPLALVKSSDPKAKHAPHYTSLDDQPAHACAEDQILMEIMEYKSAHSQRPGAPKVAGVVVTGIEPERYKEVCGKMIQQLNSLQFPVLALVPQSDILEYPNMQEVQRHLRAKVLFGHELLQRNPHPMKHTVVATLSAANLVMHCQDVGNDIVLITHATRMDIVLSIVTASKAKNTVTISGIILTGIKEYGDEPTMQILQGLGREMPFPVLGVEFDTYSVASRLHDMVPKIMNTSVAKMEEAEHLFDKYINKDITDQWLNGRDVRPDMTKELFQVEIVKRAREKRRHIVLPEGDDPRVVQAAGELKSRGLCDLTLLGQPDLVESIAVQRQVDLTGVTVINPLAEKDFENRVNQLVELRKSKGMIESKARDIMSNDFTYWGTLMMQNGMVDGMVSGARHTTADTMRPALQIIKTQPGHSLVSSVFFMLLPDKVYVFGDCAINVEPNAEQMAEIAVATAKTAAIFGIDPRVAMLSYATGTSNTGPMIEKVEKATALAQQMLPGVPIAGPLQFDAAVDPAVAREKVKGGENEVAGRATVLIFPDLNTGNNTYKAVQQTSKCIAMGPIMQGLRRPINDLSRGCTVEDIVNTVIITCLQAEQQ